MKFLCAGCDEPMRLRAVEGPEEASVSVTFGCPRCGCRVVLLTNPLETQLVRALGVRIGGRRMGPEPLEVVSTALGSQREDAIEGHDEEGPAWTREAEARLERLPPLARPMARRALSRYARERGATAVTPALMDEYRARMGL